MANDSTLKAILKAKCPRCHTGDIYTYPLSKIHKFSETNKQCPHCKLMYEREPGFFFGAMYVSYVFSVAILLTTAFVLFYGFRDPEYWVYVVTIPAVVVVLLPLSFRYSRVLYLYAFGGIRYNPAYK